MSHLKIRLRQINVTVGDIRNNVETILSELENAENDGIDLLVLPELVVCGYPPADLLERKSFRKAVYEANSQIVNATRRTALVFGTITENTGFGRPVFNTAIIAEAGAIRHLANKTLLPTYDIFDEFRYFEPNRDFSVFEFRGTVLGVTICEDIWNDDNEIVYHTYDINPASILKQKGAELMINISASPFTKRKSEVREKMLRNHAVTLDLPIVYANQVGANTEVIFDGDSMFMQRDGTIAAATKMFEDDTAEVTWNSSDRMFTAVSSFVSRDFSVYERMFKALKLGIRDYFDKMNLPHKALLGLSGGIDSALVAVLAAEALGSENVTGVTMPSKFSSAGSISDSQLLASNLGINFHQITIEELFETFGSSLEPLFKGTPFGIAEENLQSRIRGVLLMAISNKFGSILLNTGNKSEMAVGYCTLYGDMNGGLSVISDVYKTEVFGLCRWLNEVYYGREVIPVSTLTKPPSAELRPDQKDTDSLPEYDELDKILHLYIEEQRSAEEMLSEQVNLETAQKVIKMVDFNEFKRRQSPPGLRLSAKAFGIGRRIPIVQRWR